MTIQVIFDRSNLFASVGHKCFGLITRTIVILDQVFQDFVSVLSVVTALHCMNLGMCIDTQKYTFTIK